jgi:hypothetical protein
MTNEEITCAGLWVIAVPGELQNHWISKLQNFSYCLSPKDISSFASPSKAVRGSVSGRSSRL